MTRAGAGGGAEAAGPWGVLALLFVVFAAGAITATYGKLSHTADEPMHVACGLQWWQEGTHVLNPENPPLAHVFSGLGMHLSGHRLPPTGAPFRRGTELLYEGDYGRNLTRARLGTLPFFLLAALVVWSWARHAGGPRAAFVAVASFATLPPVLGHAGLATTDVPFLATFLLALYAVLRWLEAPDLRRAALAGAALGLALATKFSTLLFLPPALVALVLGRWRGGGGATARRAIDARRLAAGSAAALAVGGLVVWGVHRFSFGSLADLSGGERLVERCFPDEGSPGRALGDLALRVSYPAPELLQGFLALLAHVKQGHSAWLLGEKSEQGFALFYPVVLAVKTPFAFLALLALGAAGLWRAARPERWGGLAPALAAAAIVLAAMPSTINLGVRHVLVAYPLLAIAAGVGVSALLEGRAKRWVAAAMAALLFVQLLVVVRARSDLVAWFNPLAGDEPGEVLLDSDLDWGQDVLKLAEFFEGRDVDELHVAVFGSARLCEHGLPPLRWLAPGERVTGWVAVSEMYFRGHWNLVYDDACERRRATPSTVSDGYGWLREYEPVARAGASIRIYRVPEE